MPSSLEAQLQAAAHALPVLLPPGSISPQAIHPLDGVVGDVLTIDTDGVPRFKPSASSGGGAYPGPTGFAIGDILYASDPAVLDRLAIGAENDLLGVTGGLPAWRAKIAYSNLPAGGGTWANAGNLALTGGNLTIDGGRVFNWSTDNAVSSSIGTSASAGRPKSVFVGALVQVGATLALTGIPNGTPGLMLRPTAGPSAATIIGTISIIGLAQQATYNGFRINGVEGAETQVLATQPIYVLNAGGWHSGGTIASSTGVFQFRATENYTNVARGTDALLQLVQVGTTLNRDVVFFRPDGIKFETRGAFTTASAVAAVWQDNILMVDKASVAGSGNFGQGLAASRLSDATPRRMVAMVPRQTTADPDQMGWSFFVHNSAVDTDPMSEILQLSIAGDLASKFFGTLTVKSNTDAAGPVYLQRNSVTGRVEIDFQDEAGVNLWRTGLTGAGSAVYTLFDATNGVNKLTIVQGAAGAYTISGTASFGWSTDNAAGSIIGATATTGRPFGAYIGTELVVGTDPANVLLAGISSYAGRIKGGLVVEMTAAQGINALTYGATPSFFGSRFNGAKGAETSVVTGDFIANFQGTGWKGSAPLGSGGSLVVAATENWGATATGSGLLLRTVANTTTAVTVRWTLDHDGMFYPGNFASTSDNTYDVGRTASRVRTFYGYTGDFTTTVISPLFGTVTNVDVIVRRNSATKITVGNALVSIVDPVLIGNDPPIPFGQGASAKLRVGFTDNGAMSYYADIGSLLLAGSNAAPVLTLRRIRNTWAAPTFTVSGDSLGELNFSGYDGASITTNARIEAFATQDFNIAYGASMAFRTVLTGGFGLATRHAIDGSGHFIPGADNSYDLALVATRYRAVYSRQAFINESGGAQLLMFGAVADGDFLKRSGTTIIGGTPGAGGGITFATVEVDLGSVPKWSGSFLISGLAGLTPGKQVLVSQAAAAYTGKGASPDEPELNQAVATGYVVDAANIRVYWVAGRNSTLQGNVKWNYAVSS